MAKRELVALLNVSSWCLVTVEWLFLAVPWGYLRFVIVVFPDHTHLLFFICDMVNAIAFHLHLTKIDMCRNTRLFYYYCAISRSNGNPLTEIDVHLINPVKLCIHRVTETSTEKPQMQSLELHLGSHYMYFMLSTSCLETNGL